MTIHLQRDLDKVRQQVLALGALVKDITQQSIEFLDTRNRLLQGAITTCEHAINTLEVEINEDCLKILALHQPVATDLRFIVVVLRVTNDLERMADQAVNITHRVVALEREPSIRIDLPMDKMGTAVENMVSASLDALVRQDIVLARQVLNMDIAVDQLHAQNYAMLHAAVRAQPDRVAAAMSFATISANLERIGDLCTNIAEEVVFMIEGNIVRHRV